MWRVVLFTRGAYRKGVLDKDLPDEVLAPFGDIRHGIGHVLDVFVHLHQVGGIEWEPARLQIPRPPTTKKISCEFHPMWCELRFANNSMISKASHKLSRAA